MTNTNPAIYAMGAIFAGPTADGSNGQVLVTNGLKQLSFSTIVSGVSALNSLTGSLSIAVGTSGSDVAVSASGSTVTVNIPDAGASSRGVITTGTQTIAGDKTFSGTQLFAPNGGSDSTPGISFAGDHNTGFRGNLVADYIHVICGGGRYMQIGDGFKIGDSVNPSTVAITVGTQVSIASSDAVWSVTNVANTTTPVQTISNYYTTKPVLAINLASGQTADAIQVTSYNGTAGDLFKVSAGGFTYSKAFTTTSTYLVITDTGTPGWAYNGISLRASGVDIRAGSASLVGWTANADSYNQALSVALGFNTAGVVEFNNGTAGQYRDAKLRKLDATEGVSAGPVTFAVLNASTPTATLGVYRITDRANRLAYPDGTNWRFVSDDAIIS